MRLVHFQHNLLIFNNVKKTISSVIYLKKNVDFFLGIKETQILICGDEMKLTWKNSIQISLINGIN